MTFRSYGRKMMRWMKNDQMNEKYTSKHHPNEIEIGFFIFKYLFTMNVLHV